MFNKIKSFLMTKKVILAIAVVVIVGLVIKAKSSTVTPAETTKVVRGTLSESLTISGNVQASSSALLTFQTGGQLSWVGVKAGDHVKKYQVVASLDQRQIQLSVQKYLNTYSKTRDTFDQTHYDNRDEILTDTIRRTLDAAQLDLNSSVADVQIQDISRQYANLYSPIDGVVVRADAPVAGVNVTPLATSYQIIDPTSVYFSISADQTEVTQLAVGMSGELTLDSYPETSLSGTITQISFTPTTGSSSTVYEVRFSLNQPPNSYRYRIGMTGDASFTTTSIPDALYIPSRFIKTDNNNQNYVYILKNGQKQRADIQTGIENDEDTQITSGLSEGQVVSD